MYCGEGHKSQRLSKLQKLLNKMIFKADKKPVFFVVYHTLQNSAHTTFIAAVMFGTTPSNQSKNDTKHIT